jgi:tetratricopeptide (TPR) repeat protein
MIGARMRRLRIARGLTQRELAEPRYSNAYVSTIEAGRREPSQRALEHFAAKLGVDVDELATGRSPQLEARMELQVQEARIALSGGRTEGAEKTLRTVIRGAKRNGLRRIEAKAEEARGLLLERTGEPERALECYQRADDLLRDEPPTARVDAVDGKARCFTSLGDIRYAIYILEALRDEIEREGLQDPNALARIYAGLVYSYLDAGLYTKAAESTAELERIAPRVTEPLRIAQMHLHVAQVYLLKGRTKDALASLQRSEDAYRQANLRAETGYAHLARGYVLSREGKLKQAREQLEHALSIFEETSDEKDLVRTLNELARVERRRGGSARARGLLERSIGLVGESDVPILAWAHRELGLVLFEEDPGAAEKNLRLAIELYERSEQSVDVTVTYGVLGDLLEASGDSGAGCEAYRTGILALASRL